MNIAKEFKKAERLFGDPKILGTAWSYPFCGSDIEGYVLSDNPFGIEYVYPYMRIQYSAESRDGKKLPILDYMSLQTLSSSNCIASYYHTALMIVVQSLQCFSTKQLIKGIAVPNNVLVTNYQ